MGRKYLVYDVTLAYNSSDPSVLLGITGLDTEDGYVSIFPDGLLADKGAYYTVLWDDTEYFCEVKEFTLTETATNSDGEEVMTTGVIRYFGNAALLDESSEDTGEPFAIVDTDCGIDAEESFLLCLFGNGGEEEETHRLTVYQEIEAEEYIYFEGLVNTIDSDVFMIPCIKLEEERYTVEFALPGVDSAQYTFTPDPPLVIQMSGNPYAQVMGNLGLIDESLTTEDLFTMISLPDSRLNDGMAMTEVVADGFGDGTCYVKMWRSAVSPNDIYLKDAAGTDILYEGRTRVCIPGKAGDTVYSFGEAVEKNVPLLFFEGSSELVINAPTGDIFKKLIIKRPETLLPENIANGISIAGVNGTYSDAKPEVETTVIANFAVGDLVVTPTNGNVMTKVTVQKPSTLLPENIANGISIAGVNGTHRGGGIAEVETAEEMDALLTEDNAGKYFRYLGETTDDYTQDDIYLVEEAT